MFVLHFNLLKVYITSLVQHFTFMRIDCVLGYVCVLKMRLFIDVCVCGRSDMTRSYFVVNDVVQQPY